MVHVKHFFQLFLKRHYMNLHCSDWLLNATGAASEHVSHLIMSLDGRWVASISILNHGVVSTTQQLGWTALILHHTLSCKQSVCNVAADWILMRRCYFVIPTACVRLKSEATPVQHNAFQKRFDLCSSVKHMFLVFFPYDCEPRVCFLSPVFFGCCSRSAGISFTGSGGGGIFLWLACVGLIHHQSFLLMCVIVTMSGVYCLGAGQRTDMHKQQQSQRRKSVCILANYFKSQLRRGAADLELRNMKDCSLATYCAQAATPSFFLFSASEGLERTPSLA